MSPTFKIELPSSFRHLSVPYWLSQKVKDFFKESYRGRDMKTGVHEWFNDRGTKRDFAIMTLNVRRSNYWGQTCEAILTIDRNWTAKYNDFPIEDPEQVISALLPSIEKMMEFLVITDYSVRVHHSNSSAPTGIFDTYTVFLGNQSEI